MSGFFIRNPREYRLLVQLLKKPTYRKDLNEIIGAINTPQNALELRRRGLSLPCRRIWLKDRDGKRCNPGIYALTEEDKKLALCAVREWEKKKGAATPSFEKSDCENPSPETNPE